MRARLLLSAAALAAFGGSLFGGFHLDDYAIFQGAGPHALVWPHPLTQLLTWLNYRLAGQEAVWFHAVNLWLHVGAVLLAYECLRRLLPASAAVLAASIFAVHPLQAEAVDYISARVAMVVAILALAALLAWLTGRRWVAVGFAVLLLAEAAARVQAHAYAGGALRFLRLFLFPWGFTIAPDIREPLWLSVLAAIGVVGLATWRSRKFSVTSAVTWLLIGLLALIPNFTSGGAFCVDRRRGPAPGQNSGAGGGDRGSCNLRCHQRKPHVCVDV